MRLLLFLLSLTATTFAAEPAAPATSPTSNSRSPLLTPNWHVHPNGEKEGVWIPDSYGGVTGIVLDLERIGSDEMLQVRLGKQTEPKPWPSQYRQHSDRTTKDEKNGTTERAVILIDDSSRAQTHVRNILCYKIVHQEKRVSDSGLPLRSEETHYSATFSGIRDEFEVLWFVQFEQSSDSTPATPPAK